MQRVNGSTILDSSIMYVCACVCRNERWQGPGPVLNTENLTCVWHLKALYACRLLEASTGRHSVVQGIGGGGQRGERPKWWWGGPTDSQNSQDWHRSRTLSDIQCTHTHTHTDSRETAVSCHTYKPKVTHDSLSCSTLESIWGNKEWWNSVKGIKINFI